VNNMTQQKNQKSKINPVAVGAAAVAAGAVGAAVAATLSNKNNRDKVVKTIGVVKDQAIDVMNDLKESANGKNTATSDIGKAVRKIGEALTTGEEAVSHASTAAKKVQSGGPQSTASSKGGSSTQGWHGDSKRHSEVAKDK
jgi:hypothetical protein